MIAQMTLWSHALASLICGVLALDQFARPKNGLVKAAFLAALFMTSLWSLAVAGIDAWSFVTQLMEATRDLTWIGVLYAVIRRERLATLSLIGLYATVAGATFLGALLAAIGSVPLNAAARTAVAEVHLLLRMMAAVGALVLVHQFYDAVRGPTRSGMRLGAVAVAIMWGMELVLLTAQYAKVDLQPLVALRGTAMIIAGLALALAVERPEEGTFSVSRIVAVRGLAVFASIAYVGGTIALTMIADRIAGGNVRVAQTAIVLGSAVALLTLLSNPWSRAWARVKLAKHLFRHRYDYRVEWQRFTATLGRPDDGVALDERVVKAVADLIDSPAGLLMVRDGGALGLAAAWNWDAVGVVDEPYALHLATGRIVEIDAIRGRRAIAADGDGLPEWILADASAWAIVPLLHLGTLVGAILLARPPIDRALDWEDFDLLRVAGRQAASYLAEQRAQLSLADVRRFDEFNRRFAFILHDVKNLVSQLNLVARNAERHADNPEFRADMVATLKDSSDRMNALLARLSRHSAAPQEPRQAVDVARVARRIAARTRMHTVTCRGEGVAIAQPARLEEVLSHLIQNACEASTPEAMVTVTVARHGESIALSVEDTGCGMTPAFVRDQLFRPFVSSKATGFGIGAFESKQLVHEMGGAIAVTSRPGEGTCFRITLPAATAMEAAA